MQKIKESLLEGEATNKENKPVSVKKPISLFFFLPPQYL